MSRRTKSGWSQRWVRRGFAPIVLMVLMVEAGSGGCSSDAPPGGAPVVPGGQEPPATITLGALSTLDEADEKPGDGSCSTAQIGPAMGLCTLRAAVQEANATRAKMTTIVLSPTEYRLTKDEPVAPADTAGLGGDLDLDTEITIEGNGAVVDGGARDRVFDVAAGRHATIRGLTITHGRTTSGGGGGISVSGSLDLERSVVVDNEATSADSAGSGGGVRYEAGSAGGSISQSVVTGNRADDGAGLSVMVDVAISWSTIVGNVSSAQQGGRSAGVHVGGGTATVRATIIGGEGGGPLCGVADGAAIVSAGGNLAVDTTCFANQGTDQVVAPGALGLLPDGAPAPTSPAVDAGGGGCPAADHDGWQRPRGLACDVGAFEPSTRFEVVSTADVGDSDPGDGACATRPDTAAGGACTLRAAVQEAGVTRTPALPVNVELSPGVYRLTIAEPPNDPAAAGGDLDLRGDITIEGERATVDAARIDRVFEVHRGQRAVLRGITVTNGRTRTGGGGGVSVSGSLDLDRVTIIGNDSTNGDGSGKGGGVIYGTGSSGSVTQTTIVDNTSVIGAGLAVESDLVVSWSTIFDNITAPSSPNNPSGIATGAGTTTLRSTVIGGGAGGVDCAATGGGAIATAGYNLAADTGAVDGAPNGSCFAAAGTDRVVAPADLRLRANGAPRAASVTIDGGGPGCAEVDRVGNRRPQGSACDVGAFESDPVQDEILARKLAVVVAWANRVDEPDALSEDRTVNRINKAYAMYKLGPVLFPTEASDAVVAELDGVGFPQLPSTGNPNPMYDLIQWPDPEPDASTTDLDGHGGEFDFQRLFRLEVDDLPAAYATSTGRRTVRSWIHRYTSRCDFANEWQSTTDGGPDQVWTDLGSENLALQRRTNCMLGLFALATPLEGEDAFVATPVTRTWTEWSAKMKEWLRASAASGLMAEINTHAYARASLDSIQNLADFLGDPELARLAEQFLDLYWHDQSHNFDSTTAAFGVSGSRLYQADPDPIEGVAADPDPVTANVGAPYAVPSSRRLVDTANLYDWTDAFAGSAGSTLPLTAASSSYVPLLISRDLARLPEKRFAYTSVRPGRSCDNWTGGAPNVCTALPQVTDQPNIVRQITSNPAYMMGAQTYATDIHHNAAAVQGIWFGVNVNAKLATGERSNQIVLSGVGEDQGLERFTTAADLNGVVANDVLIAARDNKAQANWMSPSAKGVDEGAAIWGSSRGLRVFLGKGDLRNLARVDGGWYFAAVRATDESGQHTGTDVAWAAVRVAGDDVHEVRDGDGRIMELRIVSTADCSNPNKACCPATPTTDDPLDCWAPVVVQMGRPGTGQYADFADFREKVLSAAWSYEAGTLTYTSPRGDRFSMNRQSGGKGDPPIGVPQVGIAGNAPVAVATAPAVAYDSPYLHSRWRSVRPTLCGPVSPTAGQDCLALDFRDRGSPGP